MYKNSYGGLLVAIDGPNGVGKTTLIENVQKCLLGLGEKMYATKEPSASPIGNFTREIAEDINGDSLACLVAADRYEHLKHEVIPKLREGCIVIMDRYILSSLILQRMDGVEVTFIFGVNGNIVMPDVQFAIIANSEVIQKRLGDRNTLTRFEKGNKTDQEIHYLMEGANELSKLEIPVIQIDNNENLDRNVDLMVDHIIQRRNGVRHP
ncbi:MAG: dTMP kinase [Ruminiclostridium sp.]|nr:dTMP kinase [Ruminiclostridium sp.]